MKTDQKLKELLYRGAFENAKWILTDKQSGEVSEYNYSEMSHVVTDGYISWYNSTLATPPYNAAELTPKNVRVKYLRQAGGLIAEINKSKVVGVSYRQILPGYTIDCYDWHYQCRHCDAVLNEIREKGQECVNSIFCPHCFQFTEASYSVN